MTRADMALANVLMNAPISYSASYDVYMFFVIIGILIVIINLCDVANPRNHRPPPNSGNYPPRYPPYF